MIEEMEYAVPLTKDELLLSAEIAGKLSLKIQEKEFEFAKIKNEFKQSILDLRTALKEQMSKLESGRETRTEQLRIEYNSPAEGKKQIFSLSGELYDTVDMTEDDFNLFSSIQEDQTKPAAVVLPVADPEVVRRRSGQPVFIGNTLSAALDEEETTAEVCSVCKECHSVLHINHDKPVCGICRDRMNLKNLEKMDELFRHWAEKNRQPEFRAQFGYGCSPKKSDTTCVRFMLPSGSWGAPVYLAGDFEYSGSQAQKFLETLFSEGWHQNA